MSVGSHESMSGQASQILILLGEMKGQLASVVDRFNVIHERIHRQDERMSRQDDRFLEIDAAITSLRESRAKLNGMMLLGCFVISTGITVLGIFINAFGG